VHTWHALWIVPLGFMIGLAFGSFGLIMTALAAGYDFFTYFFTLVLTPMLLLSGVYFPVAQMPAPLQMVASVLPLKHAIDIARPLLAGRMPPDLVLHLAVLALYACAGFFVALVLTRRRLLK
jgi:lipooligosaccharide transport system permease protein